MELAPAKGPWTATVSWAQPWHRPGRLRSISAAPRANPQNWEPASDSALDAAWTTALAELADAGAALSALQSGADECVDDPWPELTARHALFQARRRLRLAQEALTGTDAGVAFATKPLRGPCPVCDLTYVL